MALDEILCFVHSSMLKVMSLMRAPDRSPVRVKLEPITCNLSKYCAGIDHHLLIDRLQSALGTALRSL